MSYTELSWDLVPSNKVQSYLYIHVGQCICEVSADALFVCRPKCWLCVGDMSPEMLANTLANTLVGSDLLPLPIRV